MSREYDRWYELNADDVLKDLDVNEDSGLTAEEVVKRQEQYGKNKLTGAKKESKFKKFMKQFNDMLIYVLLVAAIITTLLGHMIDTVVILAVVVINALIGYLQENKAEKALDAIKGMLSLHANVIRNGKRVEIEAEDVVKGDIVLLQSGDKIPADIRLLQTNNLKVEESPLTGESLSVEKNTQPLKEDTVLGDRINMAFSGTTVTNGTATGVVVETGNDTEIGKINRSIAEVEEIKTPLIEQTTKFGKQISVAIVVFGIALFFFALFLRDYPIGELALSIIALIVAAIPEGLPAIMSILLAIGVQNMAKRNAIVRNLPSVETLGSVSVINSDKTGTLTKNEMTVRSIFTREKNYEVTGLGYSPEGQILHHGEEVNISADDYVKNVLLTMKTANDAALTKDEDGHWAINGEPTDGSLVTLAEKANEELPNVTKIDKIPFDSEYKYMAVLGEYNNEKYVFIKGAPDRLFEMAQYEETTDHPFKRDHWEEKMVQLAKKGERVLGAAYKKVPDDTESIDHDDLFREVVFLGLTGIIDPPREEAIDAIKACKQAGIAVKMITGDHPETAHAIGKQLGIGNGHGALEGRELDKMSEEELQEAVKKYDIFARTSPQNKLQLIDALQKNGEIVSMTGDGVNDAPSLKKADIGVAMGIKGTEVSKDASKMVLADDNFKTIYDAVEEGRRVYDNLRKTILFMLPTNGAEALLVAGSVMLGIAVVLTPVQILWVNLITAVTIAFALVFENLEKGAMSRPPRPRKAALLNGYYIFRIVYVSLIVGLSSIYITVNLTNQGYDHALIQTIVLNTIVFAEMFYLYNCRSERDAALTKGFFSNKVAFIVTGALILFQLGLTYVPVLQAAFGTASMDIEYWIIPIMVGLAVFIIVEIEKYITRNSRLGNLFEKRQNKREQESN
ncbi:cation-transporting P-type ATPase [Virgibacillus kimchii]